MPTPARSPTGLNCARDKTSASGNDDMMWNCWVGQMWGLFGLPRLVGVTLLVVAVRSRAA